MKLMPGVKSSFAMLILACLLVACVSHQPMPPSPSSATITRSSATITSSSATITPTSDKAIQAKVLADRISTSASDQARYVALLEVMQALAIGVYTPDGQAVVSGAERGPHDFYLYDFELHMTAQSLARHDIWALDDLASTLSEMELLPNDQPLGADTMWTIIQAGTREAVQKPTDRLALVPLLVRELGLRKPIPYDTFQTATGKDLSFDALQAFLILIDFTLPIVQQVQPLADGSSNLVNVTNGVLKVRTDAYKTGGLSIRMATWHSGLPRMRIPVIIWSAI